MSSFDFWNFNTNVIISFSLALIAIFLGVIVYNKFLK